MKALLIVVILIAMAAVIGWVGFSTGDGTVSVTVDTEKVEADAEQAVAKGKELAAKGTDAARDAFDNIDDVDVDVDVKTRDKESAPATP